MAVDSSGILVQLLF